MDQKEIRRLTKKRLSNTNVVSTKLNQYKRKLEEAEKLGKDKEYINELQSKVLEYETELIIIKNAMEILDDREKQVIILTFFQKLNLSSVINQVNASSATIYRIKNKALDTMGEILYC